MRYEVHPLAYVEAEGRWAPRQPRLAAFEEARAARLFAVGVVRSADSRDRVAQVGIVDTEIGPSALLDEIQRDFVDLVADVVQAARDEDWRRAWLVACTRMPAGQEVGILDAPGSPAELVERAPVWVETLVGSALRRAEEAPIQARFEDGRQRIVRIHVELVDERPALAQRLAQEAARPGLTDGQTSALKLAQAALLGHDPIGDASTPRGEPAPEVLEADGVSEAARASALGEGGEA